MKKTLDEQMNKEKEIPDVVRQAFNDSYATIRTKSKKKTTNRWIKPLSTAAACIILASGVLLSNDKVFAKLQAFLGLEDPGIELATQHGDIQYAGISQSSQDVTVLLENTFADAYRVGLQLEILPENIDLKDVYDVQVEFRLADALGNEVASLVSDSKQVDPLSPVSGIDIQMVEGTDKSVTLELMLVSNNLSLPSLENGKLSIESIHFSTPKEGIITVNGDWTYTLTPKKVLQQSFTAAQPVEGIEIKQSTLSNGSMHVSLVLDEKINDENRILDNALQNSNGENFKARGANVEIKGDQTFVNIVFPYSIWNKEQKLSLIIEGYEKLLLVEEK